MRKCFALDRVSGPLEMVRPLAFRVARDKYEENERAEGEVGGKVASLNLNDLTFLFCSLSRSLPSAPLVPRATPKGNSWARKSQRPIGLAAACHFVYLRAGARDLLFRVRDITRTSRVATAAGLACNARAAVV